MVNKVEERKKKVADEDEKVDDQNIYEFVPQIVTEPKKSRGKYDANKIAGQSHGSNVYEKETAVSWESGSLKPKKKSKPSVPSKSKKSGQTIDTKSKEKGRKTDKNIIPHPMKFDNDGYEKSNEENVYDEATPTTTASNSANRGPCRRPVAPYDNSAPILSGGKSTKPMESDVTESQSDRGSNLYETLSRKNAIYKDLGEYDDINKDLDIGRMETLSNGDADA